MRKGGEKQGRPGIIHHVHYVKWTWGGGGVAQLQISLKNCRRSCVDCLRVSTSRGAFEPSQLGEEQPSGPAESTMGPAPLRPPDVTHVMNDTRPSTFFTALLHPCIIVNANPQNGVGLGTRLGRRYSTGKRLEHSPGLGSWGRRLDTFESIVLRPIVSRLDRVPQSVG